MAGRAPLCTAAVVKKEVQPLRKRSRPELQKASSKARRMKHSSSWMFYTKILLTSTTVAIGVSAVLLLLSSLSLKAPVKPETREARGGAKGKQGEKQGKETKGYCHERI